VKAETREREERLGEEPDTPLRDLTFREQPLPWAHHKILTIHKNVKEQSGVRSVNGGPEGASAS